MKSFIVFIIGLMVIVGMAVIGSKLLDDLNIMEQIEGFSFDVDIQNDEIVETENENSQQIHEEIGEDEDRKLHQWIYRHLDELFISYGEPDRIDITPYGYSWYIYQSNENYIQFAVKDDRIEGAFTNSVSVPLEDIQIGDGYDSIALIYAFNNEQTISKSISSYTFELKEDDLKERPLVHVQDNIWAQLYFDTVTDELSSVRYVDEDILLIHRPYSLTYNGNLPEKESLTAEEQVNWQEGQAAQIFDLSNKIRKKHDLNQLEWADQVAEVAFLHSKEMYEFEYFSHTSERKGELSDRLNVGQVKYMRAAENIAAQYVDGIAAVEGWLNSEGHRVNLLSDEFTHLGVGVYEDYYTQNFIYPR
ncbi:CAP domain-containing protein [Salipaludibacillus sp. HK11]|uniref:CAP domain-containing protein n=1 Tax=Salipaludibacillus sp. HK11 TaxID=3394320 RepID=UPI0039FC4A62